jgi:hypothetical protein
VGAIGQTAKLNPRASLRASRARLANRDRTPPSSASCRCPTTMSSARRQRARTCLPGNARARRDEARRDDPSRGAAGVYCRRPRVLPRHGGTRSSLLGPLTITREPVHGDGRNALAYADPCNLQSMEPPEVPRPAPPPDHTGRVGQFQRLSRSDNSPARPPDIFGRPKQ